MFDHFFEQVIAADELGFSTAWIAEAHLSSEVQKIHKHPVIPHWQGEVGLNADILQLSHKIFECTKRIHTGSAVMNILCNGGPIAHAERIATFCTLHGRNKMEKRKINIGFAAGRFEFNSRATGIVPRSELEEIYWSIVKGKIFSEASEILIRLLKGETISSQQIPSPKLQKNDFRTDQEWDKLQTLVKTKFKNQVHPETGDILLSRRWEFEPVKLIPQDWRRELLQLVIGSHDPVLQEKINELWPVHVFNLSITKPEIIEDTHQRMVKAFHPKGGPWKRSYMPRTVFVFINEQAGLDEKQKRERAHQEARAALVAYWKALEGTLDPKKVEGATNNALVGNSQDIAQQILERFHPEDRLMLWFDFFNHDSKRVIDNMAAFMTKVVPILQHVPQNISHKTWEQKV